MRIVIDMQGAQTESRFRGIGRHTLSLAQGIVRNRGKHEIILALSGLFPDTIEPIRAVFDGLLPQENIRVWQAPGPVREGEPGNTWRREAAELIREAFLANMNPDVVHIPSLFEGYVDNAVTSIGRFDQTIPISVSLHDLIPLFNPDHYLKPNPAYQQYYLRKIDHLRRASLLLAVSESSRQEGVMRLGVPNNHVVNISSAADNHFRPVSVSKEETQILQGKFGLNRSFVLYTGGADERKNLLRLIHAYAKLSTDLREAYQLVLAGRMPEGNIHQLQVEASSAGLRADELRFTGYVSDDELVKLYNLCKLFVFPSWHEGFGLPALEAMACGIAVIGANTSSVPEVIGREDALFDPFSDQAIADKMAQVLTDAAFRTDLERHGLEQARRFSWDISAQRAIAAFENTLRGISQKKESDWRTIIENAERSYGALINVIASIPHKPSSVPERNLVTCASTIACNLETLDSFNRASVLPSKITWRLEGPFDSSYSLALLNREIALALEGLGHHVILHSTEGPGDFPPNRDFLDSHPDIALLYRREKTVPQEEADVTSRNLYPPRVSDMRCRLNLLHQYGWEESGFPHEWIEQFNEYLQGIACVSSHVEKVMIDNGVSIPLSISGNGVDHLERIEAEREFAIEGRFFRFLHVSSCFPRKGADVLLQAYGRVFSADNDVTLIVKTFKNPHNEIHRWLADARAAKTNYPDVIIIEEDLTDNQLKALYEQCHALVAPSRAEGFGLPLAEAMLSGLAVITTGWSGQLDFCNEKTAWLVDYRFEPANTHFDLFDSVWAEPDISSLATKMREVFDMSPNERNKKPALGKKLLLENFSWRDVASRLVNSARTWARGIERKEPRVGWITSWNTRCGIATYSEHLIKHFPGKIQILAARTSASTSFDGKNVERCWDAGDHEPLKDLRRQIKEQKLDTLVVQFNYGFFNLEVLAKFLVEQVEMRRIVIVMMHATSDPSHVPHKRLSVLAPALARCHRVLVHAPGDLNRLKALGLVANVALFPHGILDYQPSSRSEEVSTTFKVASYGFFLPHKGLLELIDAIALLRNQGISACLSMINAEYPVPESRLLIEQAVDRIKRHRLMQHISICTDYLTDEECLRRLSEANLVIFPYQSTSESSSAAVRYGLASGRPVAVTPLDIFDDVKEAVHYLPGQSAQNIADGIKKFMKDFKARENYITAREKSAERWRNAHRYSHVSRRLYGMLVALRNIADGS